MSQSLPDSMSRESWSSLPKVSQSTAQQLSATCGLMQFATKQHTRGIPNQFFIQYFFQG